MYENILKKFVPVPKIESFESYLFIGPHPDDIEVGCAPLITKLIEKGKKISFVIATDGRLGTTDPELFGDKLVKIREVEAIKSAQHLGVTDVKFLGFPDGGPYDVDSVAKAIGEQILRTKPDIVFAPDFKTRSECHSDHLKVGEAAINAVMMSGFCGWTKSFGKDTVHSVKAVALYFTDKPNSFVNISKYTQKRKECLTLFASQFSQTDLDTLEMYFKLREIGIGLRHFSCRSDGYRVLAAAHMHCLPEASKW
ncbi:MAG TPA: PIG-L family deacetylase [Clostridia bacterium]|nr:PIG-L family deacetylase [Clostridia bacterium]